MTNKKYIVKSLTPWMMDELKSFSSFTKFDLILLRRPEDFYKENLEQLELNGVEIYIEPFAYNFLLKKVSIITKFFFSNIFNFDLGYNTVIGLKSMLWFLRLNLDLFSKESKMHAQFATQPTVVALLLKKYYSNKPELSFTFHAYDIYFNNKWFKVLIKNCHIAFSISNYNIKYVQMKFTTSKKIVLSRLGVFRDIIHKKDNGNKKSDYFTIGLMSWFWEKKGIGYLLEAFVKLKAKGYNSIKLQLAGDGPLKDKFRLFIADNDLSNNVELIGKIKGQVKDDFYNSLDVFVLPSIELKNDQDGIPVVLMEAIAYSIPIISTNVSGIPEICIDNYNGRLIEEKNSESLCNSIIELYESVDVRNNYAKNSFELSKEYDIELNSKKKLLSLKWIKA